MANRRRSGRKCSDAWDRARLRSLRRHLGLTQQGLADELGVRQQTVSEWEIGAYRPRGASARLLGIVAERASFRYEAGSSGPLTPDNGGTTAMSAPASGGESGPVPPDVGVTAKPSAPASDNGES